MAETASEHAWKPIQDIPMALPVARNGAKDNQGVDVRPMGATARMKEGRRHGHAPQDRRARHGAALNINR